MSPNVKQILISVVVSASVLLVYDWTQRAERERMQRAVAQLVDTSQQLAQRSSADSERLAQRAQAIEADSNRLAQHAEAIEARTQELRAEVSAEHDAAAEQRQAAELAAFRAEGLQAAAGAKVAVAEYYLSNGKLPASNKAIGLAPPEQFKGRSLRRLEISDGGVITLTYDANSGVDDGRIRMIPDVDNASVGVRWRCLSPDFADIARSVPQCEYRPNGS